MLTISQQNYLKILRSFVGLIWVFIAGDFIANYFLQPKLPSAILEWIHNNPLEIYSKFFLIISLSLLAIASLRIVFTKRFAKTFFITAAFTYLIYCLLLNPKAVYQWISFFDDSIILIIGIIIGLLFSQPFNQLFNNNDSFLKNNFINLATVRNIRILCIASLVMFILNLIVDCYSNPSMPQIFLNFSKNIPSDIYLNYFLGITLLIYLLSLIGLFCRFKFAKYLFSFATIGMLLGDSPQPDALTGLDAFVGNISIILNGILLVCIFCQPALQRSINFNLKRFNIFRTIILSFYSKPFYKEIAFKWQGIGFFYLLTLIAICSIAPIFKVYQINPISQFLTSPASTMIINQFPEMHIDQQGLSIDKPVPYFIYDKNKTSVAVIDTSGKYISLDNLDASLKVLITKDNVFLRGQQNNIIKISNAKLLKDYDCSNINKFNLKNLVIKFQRMGLIFLYFQTMIVKLISHLLIALLIAYLWKLRKRFTYLDYKAYLRIVNIIILTPVLILSTAFSYTGLPIIGIIALVLIIYSFYLKLLRKTFAENDQNRPVISSETNVQDA